MRWGLANHLAWQSIEGEVVVIDMRTGKAIGLNDSGSLVWRLLETADDEEIGLELSRRFSLDRERALGDVREFTSELQSRGLISQIP